MCRVLLAVLGLTLLIGLAMPADLLEETSKGVLFSYEDSINGNGFFASNNKIVAQGPHADARVYSRLSNVTLQKKDHGSGSISRETVIGSTESSLIVIDDTDMIYAYALIAALGNSSMVYAPQTMSIDNGYYATHPVNFNSLLSDKTQIKNYASQTSMSQEIEYAHAINMDLMISVEDDYSGYNPSKGVARSLMNLNGEVTSGTAHIEMLQGNRNALDFGKSAWHNSTVNIDQDYIGTFNLATKMNLTVTVFRKWDDDDWLPCCFGGYLSMPTYYQKSSKGLGSNIKGIFDCNCPTGPAKA